MTRGNQHKSDPTLAEMERQIAETREQLGAIVEELAAKADVPARAKAKASQTASRVKSTFRRGGGDEREGVKEGSGGQGRGHGHAHGHGHGHGRGHGHPHGSRAVDRAEAGEAAEVAAETEETRETREARARAERVRARTDHLLSSAQHARDKAGQASEAAQQARARAGAGIQRVSADGTRTMYAVAALSLTAATAAAVRWAQRHGDFT